MALNKTTVKKLLTSTELELFDVASSPAEIEKLTKPQLRSMLERSRKLRDKYRDLYRHQRLAIRSEEGGKDGATGNANERTSQKEELMAEVVIKLEARMAHIESAEDIELAKTRQ